MGPFKLAKTTAEKERSQKMVSDLLNKSKHLILDSCDLRSDRDVVVASCFGES